jgi:hypothetical protein
VNDFDQCARQAGKLDEANFLAWILSHYSPPPNYVFERWDDTRRKSWEGGPDRTNDLVAVLRHQAQTDQRLWLIVEFESEPERFILQRLGVYELLLSMEIAQLLGLQANAVIPVGSVVIHLTGQRDSTQVSLGVEGTNKGTNVAPLIVNLRQDSATDTLAAIASGKFGLCILPWIPLMAGGGEPAIIEEWKRLVLTETDLDKRARYRSSALVFAELIREQINWYQALENWEMKESKYLSGIRREGKLIGIVEKSRAVLLQVVRLQLEDPVPEAIRLAVEGTNDPDVLDRWLETALCAQNVSDLLRAMKENS